jgi:VIT family
MLGAHLIRKLDSKMSRLRLHSENHLVNRIGWMRAAVLGANDGIISTASLIVGVAAATAAQHDVLVATKGRPSKIEHSNGSAIPATAPAHRTTECRRIRRFNGTKSTLFRLDCLIQVNATKLDCVDVNAEEYHAKFCTFSN